ncbi:hypothetical protein Pcinc_024963 [Petrolisthes cinctipes]|uniref:Uncharacterized protein n=1 Tax=Petrolisthes cinctipes TaxID=88211 RepID=A0AAE1FA77_PETCI|nr:hypothetical protein Pcinc_024963 [Petrolisthes cinctipes]
MLVQEFGWVCRRKLRANVAKSKVRRCRRGAEDRRMNIMLDGEVLEEVECFKYLGSKVTVDSKIETELKSRVNEVGKVLGGMNRMFGCKSLRMDVKRKLYEGIAVPTALYGAAGAETRNMGENEKRRLNVVEMRCLRSMCGVTRMDRVRDEKVRRRTGVVRELAGQSVLRWFGHVERMEENRMVKRIGGSDLGGVRRRGRPQRRWMDTVKGTLSGRGVSVVQGRVIAHDTNEWRRLVCLKSGHRFTVPGGGASIECGPWPAECWWGSLPGSEVAGVNQLLLSGLGMDVNMTVPLVVPQGDAVVRWGAPSSNRDWGAEM